MGNLDISSPAAAVPCNMGLCLQTSQQEKITFQNEKLALHGQEHTANNHVRYNVIPVIIDVFWPTGAAEQAETQH